MPFTPKDGRGSLFLNRSKKSDNSPTHRGDLNIGGVIYEIAGWEKDTGKGPFLSLQAKPKEQREESDGF